MRAPAMRLRGAASMTSCRNAGKPTNGKNDGDEEDDVVVEGVQEVHNDDEQRDELK
jgi:hypothetical protein